jgi:2-hydroxycyclohexanecarboxyl-CoA dehydrogenase
MSLFNLKGKVAVVTGSSRGIGRSIAHQLAKQGAKVVVSSRKLDACEVVVQEIQAAGGTATIERCDITDYANVEAAVAAVEVRQGPTQVLVNNAGWDMTIPFIKTTQDFWKKVVDLNFYGPLHVTHAVAKGMSERGFGRIIFIASDAGRVGSSGEAVYSGCKGGTIAFAKTLARELARKSVTVNTVCPGPTNTPAMAALVGSDENGKKIMDSMVRAVPLGRIGEPEDYAGLIALLASDDGAFMTGQTISVSGGLTMHG